MLVERKEKLPVAKAMILKIRKMLVTQISTKSLRLPLPLPRLNLSTGQVLQVRCPSLIQPMNEFVYIVLNLTIVHLQ